MCTCGRWSAFPAEPQIASQSLVPTHSLCRINTLGNKLSFLLLFLSYMWIEKFPKEPQLLSGLHGKSKGLREGCGQGGGQQNWCPMSPSFP